LLVAPSEISKRAAILHLKDAVGFSQSPEQKKGRTRISDVAEIAISKLRTSLPDKCQPCPDAGETCSFPPQEASHTVSDSDDAPSPA